MATGDEHVEEILKRVEANDASASCFLGNYDGDLGLLPV